MSKESHELKFQVRGEVPPDVLERRVDEIKAAVSTAVAVLGPQWDAAGPIRQGYNSGSDPAPSFDDASSGTYSIAA